MGVYHIYPVNDLKAHNLDSADAVCWCGPDEDADAYGIYIIHHAMDDRESYQSGRKLQ